VIKLFLQSFKVDPDYVADFVLLLDPVLVLFATLSKVLFERLLVGDPIFLEFLFSADYVFHNVFDFNFGKSIALHKVGLFLSVGS
jgi:hypothetical protein